MSSHPGAASGTLSIVGVGTIQIGHDLAGLIWRISQLAITSNPAGCMTVTLQFNGLPLTTPVTVVSGTAASNPPPIDVGSHDTVSVAITNGPPNATVVVAYYYEEMGA